MKKTFIIGAIIGHVATIASLAVTAFAFKKIVIEPLEAKEQFIEENCKRAARKRIAP